MPALNLTELLSIYDIAKMLRCTAPGVHQAIDRLPEIKPAFVAPSGHRYFQPAVVEILRENMRLPATSK